MKRINLLSLAFLGVFHSLSAQNVGIGTTTPATKLDINGDVAWRTWNLNLVNGANNVITPTDLYSYYRITGPTAAYSITGIGNPENGRLVTLYNATAQTLTIQNMVGAAGVNAIRAGAGNLNIGAWGSVSVQYNTTDNVWVVVNTHGASGAADDWKLDGNTNGSMYSLGTNDAFDLPIETNGAERMRITSGGSVGIGTSSPNALLHVYASGANWDTWFTNGDFNVGDATYRFKVGVATGGVSAGDVRLTASGGTSRLMLGGGAQTSVLTVSGLSGRVGVGTYDPNTRLDVFGDLALKTTPASFTGTAPDLVLNTTGSPSSHYLVNFAAANFNLVGLSVAGAVGLSSQDGRIVMLYNRTGFTMTVLNQSILTPFANYRIRTGTGSNLTIFNGGTVTFVYNNTDNSWVVTSYNEGGAGNDWHTTGNTGTNANTNFIGTTDNQALSVRTNNALAIKVNNSFHKTLGVGMPFSNAGALNGVNGYSVLEAYGDGFSAGDITFCSSGNNLFPNYLVHAKARGTQAAPTIVNQGDLLGIHEFWGYDGSNYRVGASIGALVDQTPGANDLPTALIFGTSADGSAGSAGFFPNIAERMRITNIGNVGININNPTSKLHVYHNEDVNKVTAYSHAGQTSTSADYNNFGVMGYGRGGNFNWGFGIGVAGVGDVANSYYAQGVFAGLGSGIPIPGYRDAALYAEANSLGYAGIFRGGSVVIDEGDLNTGTIANALLFGGLTGEGIASKRNAGGNQYGIDFYQGAVNRMRIWSNGNVGIGQNSFANLQPTHKLWVRDPAVTDADINIFSARHSGSAGATWEMGSVEYYTEGYDNIGFSSWVSPLGSHGASSLGSNFGTNYDGWRWGTVYATNGTINTSDTTLKARISPIAYGLAQIRQIDPITYVWKEDRKFKDFVVPEEDKQFHLGFNAQQLKTVIPEVVESWGWLHDQEHDYKKVKYDALGVNYAEITPVVVNAVKELDQTQQNIIQNMTVSDFGMSTLNGTELYIAFAQGFKQNLTTMPAVTVSPMQPGVSLYIASIDANGFTVKVNGTSTAPIVFNWIAVGKINAQNITTNLAYAPEAHQAKLAQMVEKENQMTTMQQVREGRAANAQKAPVTTELTPEAYQALQKQLYPDAFEPKKAAANSLEVIGTPQPAAAPTSRNNMQK